MENTAIQIPILRTSTITARVATNAVLMGEVVVSRSVDSAVLPGVVVEGSTVKGFVVRAVDVRRMVGIAVGEVVGGAGIVVG